MPALDGIDVSEYQGDIDWSAAAAAAPQLKFVMSRISHGGRGDHNLRTDKRAERNRDGMRAAFPNTARGFYHFLGMGSPEVQAKHFHGLVGDLQANEFVMLDVEEDPPARVPELPVQHIADTLEAIEEQFGRTPSLYIGRWYSGALDARLHRFPLVLPGYISEARFRPLAGQMGRPVMIWQWGGGQNGERVAGIQGRVDSNVILDEGLFASLIAPGTIEADEYGLLPQLELGDTGNAVHVLQSLLVEHEIFQDADRNRDGKYEAGTKRGVERFQRQNGLPATGVVNRATWLALGFAPEAVSAKKKR